VDFFSKKYPTGPVLLNIIGKPWTDNAVWWRMDSLKASLGLNAAITPYSYRHTSITNMILGGKVEWGLIAELHGTSLQMLQRHYKHLDGHRKSMAEVWATAKGTSSNGSAEGRP
jgi:site-specific recombinase XerD